MLEIAYSDLKVSVYLAAAPWHSEISMQDPEVAQRASIVDSFAISAEWGYLAYVRAIKGNKTVSLEFLSTFRNTLVTSLACF